MTGTGSMVHVPRIHAITCYEYTLLLLAEVVTTKLEVAERETKVRQDPADEKADMCSLHVVITIYFS